MDDDEFESDAFRWGVLHEIQALAWEAAEGRIPGVSMVFGLCLVDAIKMGAIDEDDAQPYINALNCAKRGERPRWD